MLFKIKTLPIIIILFLTASQVYGACSECSPGQWYPGVTNCSGYVGWSLDDDEVDDCLADADFDGGDTINLPAGNETWEDGISATGGDYAASGSKWFNIIGQGSDQTVITDGTGYVWMGNCICVEFSNPLSHVRLSNFKLISNAKTDCGQATTMVVDTAGTFRVDHILFESAVSPGHNVVGIGNSVNGLQEGVVDHCTFDITSPSTKAFQLGAKSSGEYTDPALGDAAWAVNVNHSSLDHQIVVEDCVFNVPNYGASDNDWGSRAIWRNNDFIDGGNLNTHGGEHCEASHGYNERSGFSTIAYSNTVLGGGSIDQFVSIRGGTAMVFNNYVNDSEIYHLVGLYVYCVAGPGCNTGVCGSNCECGTSAPVDDQVGRSSTNGDNQALVPVYIWENTLEDGTLELIEASNGEVVTEGVDYYTNSSIPRVTTEPTTCSTLNDAVWYDIDNDGVFDDGVKSTSRETLYQCDGSNYQPWFTPPPYPHPLRDENRGEDMPQASLVLLLLLD